MYYYMCIFLTVSLISVGILLLKNPFFSFANSTAGLLNSMLESSMDESEKQKNLIHSLGDLLPKFLLLLLFIALTIGMSFIPIVIYLEYNAGETVRDLDMHSFYFYLSLILGSLVLVVVPWAKRDKEKDYSGWSMLLHRMVLNNYNISSSLFSLEKKLFKKKVKKHGKDFVIVTGLARGGTTALTNLMFESSKFHSLSYDNMPFLLSINLWRKLYHPRKNKLKQRAHGDNIMFGYKTIEALEEYFFKVFLGDSYIFDRVLKEHEIDADTYEDYVTYQKLIADKKKESTYLAKNNNLILRYKSLRLYNPDFKIILIFRNPVSHAYSLRRQHTSFSEMHEADPFTLEYMNWLGHHEFGLNHKVFDLKGIELREAYEITSMNYWIAVWISYYTHILSLVGDENLFLIEYTDLCERPEKLLSTLGELLSLELSVDKREPYKERDLSDLDIDVVLFERSQSLYKELRKYKVEIK